MSATFLQALLSGLVLGSIYAIVASGLSLVFGVMKIINFAHGQFLMLGLYLTYWLYRLFDLHPYASAPIVVGVMFLVGFVVSRWILEPILGTDPLTYLLTTFGLALILENGALMLWSHDYRSVPLQFAVRGFNVLGARLSTPQAVLLVGTVITLAVLFYILLRTRPGLAIRAVAQNWESAELAGINVRRTFALAVAIGTALVGAAAVLMIPIYFVFPGVGTIYTVMAFVVVVLGGLGSIAGAVVGGLIIGVAEILAGTYLSVELARSITFLIFLAILFFRPLGLFGQSARV